MKSETDFRKQWPIETEWRIYASVNYAISGSDNGLLLVQCQAIDWTNAVILLVDELLIRNKLKKKINQVRRYTFENAKWRPFCNGPNTATFYSISMLF